MSLLEIQEKVDLSGELEDLSEEQKEALLRELNGRRELKQTGARASNISAAQDLGQTMERTATEVSISFLSGRESRLVTFDSCNTCPVALAVSALLPSIYSGNLSSGAHDPGNNKFIKLRIF
jgi:hypothetical protein